ncbi:MAG TPA: polysaccharide lyase family 7 protein [Pirellulales bacterium]
MKTTILFAIALALTCALVVDAVAAAPSTAFDLHDWKLQIPGPRDIKALENYSSEYFNLNAAGEMCFDLNAAEKGTTPNAKYVRSELRHLPNWKTSSRHQLSAELRVISALKPDKVTVLQIHGITEKGGDAPPLLRIAENHGDLVAVIQTGNARRENETIVLQKGLGTRFVKIDVTVEAERLSIRVNGEQQLSRGLAFWKFPNYFKAGCYPQATAGTPQVMFRKLTAN